MPSLILHTENISANIESERIIVSRREIDPEGKVTHQKSKVPLHDLERVILVGRPSITVPVLQKLLIRGIPCYFVTSHNRWLGSLQPDGNMDAERRIRQYETARNADLQLRIARQLVATKISNSRRVLQRLAANRQQAEENEQKQVTEELKTLGERASASLSMPELRGLEGLAAARYFQRLSAFFPEKIPFRNRTRRPPKDPANALLSWSYTILLGEIECEIRKRGLDPCIGFLHERSHGAPSLALDLLEPLRAPVCDLLTLNILNHEILDEQNFAYNVEDGGIYLREDAYPPFFQAYERSMSRKFSLTKDGAHTDFRQIIADQVTATLHALDGAETPGYFKMP